MSDFPWSKGEALSKEAHVQRAIWINEEREKRNPQAFVTAGDNTTMSLAVEVNNNFINAQFLSVIVLAAAVIEQTLARQVKFVDKSKRGKKMTLGKILNHAERFDLVSNESVSAFESLYDISDLRNDVVHYRGENPGDSSISVVDQMSRNPNAVGEEEAKKMICAMFDITSKCTQNESEALRGQGPLTQGIETHSHGEEFHCPKCDINLKDRELEYDCRWNGEEVVEETMECPDCGENVAQKVRSLQKSSG